jgi:hypothetical protein
MGGLRKALIVANDQYEHEGLEQLMSPGADAEALASVLGDAQVGAFDVQVVRNEPAHVVQRRIEDLFAESRTDDVLLLHFSCHGLKSESGELFFAARDTRPNRLRATAVSADFVQRCMQESRSGSVVLLLDCCYGGAFSQGVSVRASGNVNVRDSFPSGELGGGRGRAVITASSSMEFALDGNQLAADRTQRPSVFTAALVEGLATGEADRDEDGLISLNELYDYVFDRVREQNPHQTPSRDIEMQGELYLARSRRRRIHPAPIPADLRAAMTDPNMFTRLGAVSELRSWLASTNLPAALAASAALADMAGADIGYVAEAAARVLREAAVRAVERDLHFGRVVKDSGRVHRTVHLQGPPLARACTFRASDSRIRIEEAPEGLDVSVDTSQPGQLLGHIAITGPAGEAVATIPVEVEVISGLPTPPATKPVGTVEPTSVSRPTPFRPTGVATPPPRPAAEAGPEALTNRTVVPEPKPAPEPEPRSQHSPRRWFGYGGAATACLAVLAGALVWHPWSDGHPPLSPSTSASPYTPSSSGHPQSWRPFAPLPVAVEGAGAASFHDQLWVAGGNSADADHDPLSAVQVFDPATGRWSRGPSLPQPVGEAGVVSTGRSLYVIGGGRAPDTPLATVYRLDDPGGRWTADAPLPQARISGAAAYDGTRILYAGGVGPDREDHGDVFAFQNGAWQAMGSLHQPRDNLAAASDGQGSVWFLGGSNPARKLYRTVERVRGGEVVQLGNLFVAVRTPAAVWWPGAGACLIGGEGDPSGRVSCLARPEKAWDPPVLSQPRAGLAAAIVGDHVYTAGGYFGSTPASRVTEAIPVE